MRVCIIILLFCLMGGAIAKNSAPKKPIPKIGYMTKGSHVLVCDCSVKPPVSECGDSINSACGTKESCTKLCKQTACKESACIVSSKGHAQLYCNDNDGEAMIYLKSLRANAHLKFWKAKHSKCGF